MALVVGTNSYGSVAEADAYFLDSLRSTTWAGFTEMQKSQGLVEATRALERETWQGTKEDENQTLSFPRIGLTDRAGNSVSAAASLEIAKQASFEFALILILDPTALNVSDSTGTNIKQLVAGSAEIEYFRPERGTRFPFIIHSLIGQFLSGGSGNLSIATPFASGVNEQSTFVDIGRYGVSEGL